MESMEKYTTLISIEDAQELLASGNAVWLDCSFALQDTALGRQQYMAGHIPGAHYLDLNHDLSSPVIQGVTGRHPLPDPEVIRLRFSQCGIHDHTQVIVYDQTNGAYASRAWWLLQWLGHEAVAVLDGGFAAWKTQALPIDNRWTAPVEGHLTPVIRDDMIIRKESIPTLTAKLIDSREKIRFTGASEPIDSVAGHIPGAVCLPFGENMEADGKWKNKEALRLRFQEIGDADHPPVFYCGSGVTACHNVLAYKIATDRMAQLYPGSYSEWINYYPVVQGE